VLCNEARQEGDRATSQGDTLRADAGVITSGLVTRRLPGPKGDMLGLPACLARAV
jgi:hypothetical protein